MRKNVVALILEKDNKFLIEKRKENISVDAGKFVFPGGHVDGNESLEEAIRREAMEELGIKLIHLELIYTTEFNGPEEKQKLYWFWCNNYAGEIQNNEAEQLLWIGEKETHKLTYQVSRDAINTLLKNHKK